MSAPPTERRDFAANLLSISRLFTEPFKGAEVASTRHCGVRLENTNLVNKRSGKNVSDMTYLVSSAWDVEPFTQDWKLKGPAARQLVHILTDGSRRQLDDNIHPRGSLRSVQTRGTVTTNGVDTRHVNAAD